MRQSSIPLNNNHNADSPTTQSLSEIVLPWVTSSVKSILASVLTMLILVISPVWNHPKRMRLLTHWLIIALSTIIILWGLFWLGKRPVFNLEQVQVMSANGQELEHIQVPAIKAKVISQLSGNFFSIKLGDAREAFEEIPWVRSASVRRVWPNQLHVSIEEQEPVGVWFSSTGPELVNKYGELFTVNLAEAGDKKDLVSFQGPPNSNKEVLELFQKLNEWFKPLGNQVVALTLSPRYSWTAKLDNGMVFELGRDLNPVDHQQMQERLNRFLKMWPEVQKRTTRSVEYVDLRYNNGFALRSGSKLDSKSNDISLAGLNQKLSMPPMSPMSQMSIEALSEELSSTPKNNLPKNEVPKEVKGTVKKVMSMDQGRRKNK